MTIHFRMSGGFAPIPALSRTFLFDTGQLTEADAEVIESMIERSHFFAQPPITKPSKGAADFRTYTITVEDGQHSHTVQLVDPVTEPNLQRLVSQMGQMARASVSHQ